jgi:hypothetical protein
MMTMIDGRNEASENERTGLRDHFIGWQCRIRQLAVRRNSGEPLAGMRPRVLDRRGHELSPGITTLILKKDPAPSTDQFRHVYKRTHDPRDRYAKALEILAGTYFQRPSEFGEELTALFAPDSATASRLVALGECVLEFEQFSQGYRIPCRVEDLTEDNIAYQATRWHNSLFNPSIPPNPRILTFSPIWSEATVIGNPS